MKTNANLFYFILAGAAAGALVGFLFATDKGNQFREDIADQATRLGSTIRDKTREGIDKFTEATSGIIGGSNVAEHMEDIAENIKGGFDKVKSKNSQYAGKSGVGGRNY